MPLALFALSCTKDLEAPDASVIYERVPLEASIAQPSTKTSVDEKTGKVSWVENDLIRYYSKKEGEIKTLNIGTILNEGTAQIEPEIAISANFMIAAYGGSGISDNEGQGFIMSGVITGVQDGTFVGSHAAVAKIQKSNNGWPDKLVFKNIIPFVSFTLGSKAEEVDYAVFEAGNGEKLHSDGKLYVSFDGTEVKSVTLPDAAGGSSIKVPISGAGTYYIALAPGSYEGFSLNFYKSTGGGADKYIGSVTSENTLTLAMKSLVRLGTIDDKIQKVYTDLSKDATANSYVVSKVGDYKIRADVKGDGAESIDLSGNIYPVLFWESEMTAEVPSAGNVISDLRYDNGFLTFSSGVDGNAVIGIQNADEATLWSWHIWVCSGYDPAATATGSAGLKVLDRNLGALAAGEAGLVYQWGRKDPFFDNSIASIPGLHDPFQYSDRNGTVEKAIDFPNAVIQQGGEYGDWIYGNPKDDLWGATKLYDPCPAGWRVPDQSFATQAAQWSPAGNYWTSSISERYAVAFNAAEPLGRATLAMVRCVAENKIEIDNISLSKSSLTIDPGEQVQLTASISPANASVQTVKWTTSDSDIATVVDGLVTGVGIGECTITAEADGKSAVCNVVCGTPVSSVTVTPTGIVVAPGATRQLNATIAPAEATVKTLEWTSSDPEVATVDENGVVTGVAEGTCVIKAIAHNGEFGSCEVEVADHKVYDLSKGGTANCYIVNAPGDYSFYANVRGSSSIPLGDLSNATAIELWSTINSAASPMPGALIKNVDLANSVVYFTVPDPMVSGNAVIAVRDADSNIMWSWHIWLVEGYDPDATAQTYFNNAGIMMDRNLGALSAEVNDPRAVGFLYQWGRKDPFPAAQSFSGKTAVPYATSVSWPAAISAGSIETSVRNPMRFMKATATKQDWYDYTSSNDAMIEGRWSRDKTEYDPCPAGWRVPDGGASGVWSTAFGRSDGFSAQNYWLGGRYGYNFNGLLGDNGETMIWYPATAYINSGLGNISGHGQYAMYWSCTTYGWNTDYNRLDERAHQFYFYTNTSIQPAQSYVRAQGCAVRCLKIGSFYGVPLQNLSIGKEGTTSTSITIKVGETRKLPLIFNPENASNKTIRVTSIDPSFVTIDTDGNVKGIKATYGPVQVTVTAADGDRTVTCNVSVEAQ